MKYKTKLYICIHQTTKNMKTIQILKNGKLVKQFFAPEKLVQKYFAMAYDIAGGMWNGKDNFTVQVL